MKLTPFIVLQITLILVLMALSIVSLSIGAVSLSFLEVLDALLDQSDYTIQVIVQDYRLPRVVLAWLVGTGLAVSGTLIQSAVRNPLASPDIIGISAGAGLAAATVLMLFPELSALWLPLFAFMGGIVAALIIYFLADKGEVAPLRLALVGVAVGAVFGAGIDYLMISFPNQVNLALAWLTGSLWAKDWRHVFGLLPWVLLLLPISLALARQLDVLALGNEPATALGVQVNRSRRLILIVSVALASASVAAAGTLGFLALVAPHMATRLVGAGAIKVIPMSALLGVLFLLLSDIAGRVVMPPVEIPAGVVTALLGAPYFLYLLSQTQKS
jgi:ABC-type Fe3+-siderophore transport system permease subunit